MKKEKLTGQILNTAEKTKDRITSICLEEGINVNEVLQKASLPSSSLNNIERSLAGQKTIRPRTIIEINKSLDAAFGGNIPPKQNTLFLDVPKNSGCILKIEMSAEKAMEFLRAGTLTVKIQ